MSTPKKWSQKAAQTLYLTNARLELENMKLKLKLENLAVENLNVVQDIFAVTDSLFSEDDVRTLREAATKWEVFKRALEETNDMEAALDRIDRESVATPEANAALVSKWWAPK
jgi:predicted metal-binding transcription factor (methanogenesis marker protein 9)